MIHLGSYAPYDKQSQQYEWLLKDLAGFSRSRTPWLFVNFHSPWYHTYIAVSCCCAPISMLQHGCVHQDSRAV